MPIDTARLKTTPLSDRTTSLVWRLSVDGDMAVQFILGRSGTGKTSRCIGAIAEALLEDSEQPLIFLVPEQATYQAERAVLSDERIAGFHRLHILSFDRLQFLLLGKSTARPQISATGRQMIVHKILRDVQADLRVFRSSALLPGFARQMAEMVTELHRYARSPEDVDEFVARLQQDKQTRLSELKFADIAMVFRRYCELMEQRFVDTEAQIGQACRVVRRADFVRNARLWVDGFAGFTGAELALLTELLRVVERAHVALCVDPLRMAKAHEEGPPAAEGLFEPTERTYLDLLAWAHESRTPVLEPVVLEDVARFADCRPLAHIERNIFRPGAGTSRADDHVRLVSAPNLRCEIQFVARQVCDLVRERGYRYRDIAVVASDLNRYEHYVRAYFDDYSIPCFIDRRRPLSQHPAVELIGGALQTVIGGFAHGDVFAYLKTDLVPVDRSRIDVLENYCLAFGVGGRDWLGTEPWRFKAPDDEAFDEVAVNATRNEIVGPLRTLRQALCPQGDAQRTVTPGDFARAVFGLLDVLRVRQTVGRWIDQAQQAGDLTVADEHRQFYDRLVDIFDELVEVFEGAAMTAEDYLGLLHSAFSQMTLAFIPPRLDQVLVGSIERSRHPNLKAVFLLGATQKQFPVPIPSAGVLTDTDRETAEALGFRLAPGSTQSLVERQYLAYIAFTRPSEWLCVSYPSVDEKGSPVVRSHFVDELALLFEDLAEESIAGGRPESIDVHTQAELAELLCSRLGRDAYAPEGQGDTLRGVLDAMRADGDLVETADSIRAALDYDNRAALQSGVVERLFGQQLPGSATRLATFAACPFKYFVRYTLGLEPRKEFKLEPLDLGNFYHAVLDALHKRLVAEGQNFATADDDQLIRRLREQIEAFASQDAFISKFRSRSDHNAFIISNASELLEACVLEIAQMARAGTFEPVLAEVAFGEVRQAQESLGRFELALPTGGVLTLSGKIDRMDIAEVDGQRVALVFDYKRTKAATTFNWPRFYHGLNLQLPMYLLALSEAAAAPVDRVAGAFCMPIEHAPESASVEESARKVDRFRRKAKGLFNGEYAAQLDPDAGPRWSQFYNFAVTSKDQQYGYYASTGALKPDDFQRVLTFTRNKMIALASEIVAGRLDVHPYRLGTQVACSHCDFKAVCRFDWQINDYHFLDTKSKSDVVEAMARP